MNIKTNIKVPVIVMLLLVTFSCNNWLELEPENKLVQQEFWKKKEDISSVVAAMYDAHREGAVESWVWGELRADMVAFTGTKVGSYRTIAEGEIRTTNSKVDWKKYYEAINLANTVLIFIDEVYKLDDSFDEKLKESYKAEALFIRAINYFYLTRIWKDVPLVLKPSSSDTVDFAIPKTQEHLILNQIEQDLLTASEKAYKDENSSDPAIFKGRANYYSIQALLADVYLWAEKYEKCVSACNNVINSGKFSLQTANNWFELYYPGNAPESIFEIQYNDALDHEENPFNKDIVPTSGSKQISLQAIVKELFASNDFRNTKYGPIAKYEYTNPDTRTKRKSSERDVNFIYYRLADILLLKAEALAELDRFAESNQIINTILERASQTAISLQPTKEEFRTFILEERARELALEGKRWFDVLRFAKRNNFENKSLIVEMILAGASPKERPKLRSRVLDTMSYYLPIPEKELETNPKLIQNPFYDR